MILNQLLVKFNVNQNTNIYGGKQINMKTYNKEEPMVYAIGRAKDTMREGYGGPFGAAIIDNHGNIVSIASNTVLRDHDPTAHAEMNAIRQACQKLGTHDLKGYTLYATGYPCPMCLGAIIWANIDKVYYGCIPEDADKIGFRDDFIYDFIKGDCTDNTVLDLEELSRDDCLELFEEYSRTNKQLY